MKKRYQLLYEKLFHYLKDQVSAVYIKKQYEKTKHIFLRNNENNV